MNSAAWQRLSPRMLLVHPVHEVLNQLPLLVGAIVLGSATQNPVWSLVGVGFIVLMGVARWFTTSYRIDYRDITLRTGLLRRNELAVPRKRSAVDMMPCNGVRNSWLIIATKSLFAR